MTSIKKIKLPQNHALEVPPYTALKFLIYVKVLSEEALGK
jgi:hypothetical protein